MQSTPRRLLRCAAASLLLLALNACNQAQQAVTDKRSVADADRAAEVNGVPISTWQVERHAAQRSSGDAPVDSAEALQELVNLQLLREEAIRRGLDREAGTVEELYRQQTAVLANALIERYLEEMELSDAELRAEYDAQLAALPRTEFKARHILLAEEAQAQAVIQELADGADFAALAEERSTGPSARQGGDLGWFRANQMVPAFATALQSMQPGAVSTAPVQTRFGWHVIKLEETRDVPLPEFEDVKERLRSIVTGKRVRSFVEELRGVAKIEIKQQN